MERPKVQFTICSRGHGLKNLPDCLACARAECVNRARWEGYLTLLPYVERIGAQVQELQLVNDSHRRMVAELREHVRSLSGDLAALRANAHTGGNL